MLGKSCQPLPFDTMLPAVDFDERMNAVGDFQKKNHP